ncbi:unnamed protein product [Dovyalis caffra]|uniref:Sialate O-acetylesterase domain-containing protein n=1 Tax=Dovyalis caffra TaxID=77055 RepID=A0AAV1SF86_9ROSI|nr:unnamed protein product [Dovyalis caffra]
MGRSSTPEVRPNPKVLALTPEQGWKEAGEPLHAGIDTDGPWGVGPGIAFAHEILANGSGSGLIGLVPCARSNSHTVNWESGTYFYKEMVIRAKESLQERGRIRALLRFKNSIEKFFADLRDHLNMPSLLIIQMALASGEGKFTEDIRNNQLAISLPNVKLVDAKGLNLKKDKLGLTADSQVQPGKKLAHFFLA